MYEEWHFTCKWWLTEPFRYSDQALFEWSKIVKKESTYRGHFSGEKVHRVIRGRVLAWCQTGGIRGIWFIFEKLWCSNVKNDTRIDRNKQKEPEKFFFLWIFEKKIFLEHCENFLKQNFFSILRNFFFVILCILLFFLLIKSMRNLEKNEHSPENQKKKIIIFFQFFFFNFQKYFESVFNFL